MTEAITKAIEECLQEGILKDILLIQRNEVMSMALSTFNKELYEKYLKEEAFEEGVSAGEYRKLKALVVKKINKGLFAAEIADLLEEDITTVKNIVREIQLSEK